MQEEGGNIRIALGRLQPTGAGEAVGRGNGKPRRTQKGKQFENVEARQFGIAQPLSDQRRVEQDDWGFRCQPDRLAP